MSLLNLICGYKNGPVTTEKKVEAAKLMYAHAAGKLSDVDLIQRTVELSWEDGFSVGTSATFTLMIFGAMAAWVAWTVKKMNEEEEKLSEETEEQETKFKKIKDPD